MEVRLTPEHSAFVRLCVGGRRFVSAESVIEHALKLFIEQDPGRASGVRAVKIGLEQVQVKQVGFVDADLIRQRADRFFPYEARV
jgi:Arc/MetJ-type ribon-helix-helix transcriptional regulator